MANLESSILEAGLGRLREFSQCLVLPAIAAVLVCGSANPGSAGSDSAVFTTRVSVELSRFGSLEGYDEGGEHEGAWPGISPDDKVIVFVTTRGRVRQGDAVSTIWRIETEAIRRFLAGTAKRPSVQKILSLQSSTNGPEGDAEGGNPIRELRWLGSHRLLMLSADNSDNRRLSVVDAKTGTLTRLSKPGRDVTVFDGVGANVVFASRNSVDVSQTFASSAVSDPDVQEGRGQSLFDLLYPHFRENTRRGDGREISIVQFGRTGAISHTSFSAPSSFLRLSSNGTLAVSSGAAGTDVISLHSGQIRHIAQLQLARMVTGSGELQSGWRNNRELLIARSGPPPRSVPNSLLTGHTTAPNCDVAAFDARTGATACAITAVTFPRGETSRLSELVGKSDGHIILSYAQVGLDGDVVTTSVACQKAGFCSRASGDNAPGQLTVFVRQSLNGPPMLFARASGPPETARVIFNPNPQLSRVALGRVKVFSWWVGPKLVRGILAYPPDYSAGHKYPLVIQGHGVWPHRFLSTGGFETGYAARALASRGIVVLQLEEPCESLADPCRSINTPAEFYENGEETYLAAIDALAAAGIIDDHKVGLLGFSHTGMYVLNALTARPDKFAAAVMDEAAVDLGSYFKEVDYRANGPDAVASVIGADPVGTGLKDWLDKSSAFHLDRIRTPIFFEAGSAVPLIYSWDTYAALRVQRKPVDLLYFRRGKHSLVKTTERFVLQEANVDWFDFWLNGHEDSNPAKRNQYQRWHELKKELDKVLSAEVPPWLHWKPTRDATPAGAAAQ